MAKPLSIKEQINQNNILYLALFGGQMMLALVMVFINNTTATAESEAVSTIDSSYTMIAALITVGAIALSFFLYNKRKAEGARLAGDLEGKLAHYRASFVMRASLIEGANLVAILFYFSEGNVFYLILFTIGIAAFLMVRPTVPKIIEDYQLSSTEQQELQNAVN